MNIDSIQKTFLNRVSAAIGRSTPDAAFEDLFPGMDSAQCAERLAAIRQRPRKALEGLLEALRAAAGPLNLGLSVVPDAAAAAEAVVDLILDAAPEWGDEKSVVGWDHPLVASLDLQSRLTKHGIPFDTPRPSDSQAPFDRSRFRSRVERAFVGVTSADYCVADTATLTMITRPGEPRTVSLVPSIHVAVIRMDQLVADLTELYTLIDPATTGEADTVGRCMTFISGPSKTADIELVMVHGAHGPRAMHLYVITE